jgi:hypothetical protein
MEAQVQQLITNLNGQKPTRADVIGLLNLIVGEENKMQWVEMYGNATDPKLIDDIKSYPQFYAKS